MDGKKLVPKRRFREFDNNWTSDILDNLLDVNSGQDYKHLEKGDIPVYGTGGYMLSVNDKLSSFDGVGIGRKGTIDKPVYLKAPFWTVDTLFYMLPKEKINIHFLYYLSKNINWKNYDESTGVPSLSRNTINNIRVFITNLKEQQKIGEFFKVLDERIANQERKIAKVKALKEAYLTEMFPQEGETLPKRRFKGFEEEWIKKKLDDVAFYRRGSFPQPYGEHKWYNGVGAMPFVQVVDVDKNLRLVNETRQKISRLAQPHSVYVEKGKILVTLQGSIGRVAITQYPSYVDRTLLIFEDYKIEMDNNYFAYIIEQLFEIEKQKAPGGTIKTITKEALSEFIIRVPDYKEQQKIGSFFKNLDDQIRVEEARLEKLKKMKEAYLEEMFV